MNRNLVIGIVVVIVLIGAGWFLLKDQMMPSTTQTETTDQMTVPSDSSMMQASPEGMMESTDSAMSGAAKEFTVTGSNFKFDMSEIKVKAGDTVKITFKNAGGFHDFVIDEFNVAAKQQNGPVEETVTFVADKAGTYEYYCSVGQHRAMGMKGNLIVE
jgi:plastocyanin